MKWLGHEIDQEGYKTEQRKSQSHSGVETPEIPKLKYFLLAIHFLTKLLPRLSERTDKLRKRLKKNTEWKWETEQQDDLQQ